MNKNLIIGHPFGNANVRSALDAFYQSGCLQHFFTAVCAEKLPLRALLPSSILNELDRRSFPSVPKDLISTFPRLELTRLVGRKFNQLPLRFPTVDDVWRNLDKRVARYAERHMRDGDQLYLYEDGAASSFAAAPGIRKYYELPIAYYKTVQQILEEEEQREPLWSSTLAGRKDSLEKLVRKDAELELADDVIVPSDFVRSSLPKGVKGTVHVTPYGCPSVSSSPREVNPGNRPLRLLYCGSLSQRKGLSYLFGALSRLGTAASLTVIGSRVANTTCRVLENNLERVDYVGSLPNHRVLEQMRSHDILVFPTLCEGRALVVLEALSQGLPVITTNNSGTADLLENTGAGFVVPIRSTEAIEEAVLALHDDRGLLGEMSARAKQIASRNQWADHQSRLLSVVVA